MEVETLSAAAVEHVWEALDALIGPGRRRDVPVEDAIDHVLAADARSENGFPPFDRALMDGYAVRASDFADGRAELQVAGLIRAGMEKPPALAAGTCAQINTGAPIPDGADAVVMVENSQSVGEDLVELKDQPAPGQNINQASSLLAAGDLIARAGTRVQPGTVAGLVAGGLTSVEVFGQPRVALLSTGDELVEHGAELKDGQIHDTNTIMLEQLIQRAGGETVMFGRCPDEPAALRASLELGLANDLLCITGGMSKGTHDLVPGLLEELGVHWLVKRLHLKPGRPAHIGRSEESGCWVVGLPGNPVSCAVCFVILARGILARLQGMPTCRPTYLQGRLQADLPTGADRPMLQPAEWSAGPHGEVCVMPLPWRGSGNPFGMAIANALIHRPEQAPAAPRGELVQFIPFDLPQ